MVIVDKITELLPSNHAFGDYEEIDDEENDDN